jgi:hypothetical protein
MCSILTEVRLLVDGHMALEKLLDAHVEHVLWHAWREFKRRSWWVLEVEVELDRHVFICLAELDLRDLQL